MTINQTLLDETTEFIDWFGWGKEEQKDKISPEIIDYLSYINSWIEFMLTNQDLYLYHKETQESFSKTSAKVKNIMSVIWSDKKFIDDKHDDHFSELTWNQILTRLNMAITNCGNVIINEKKKEDKAA